MVAGDELRRSIISRKLCQTPPKHAWKKAIAVILSDNMLRYSPEVKLITNSCSALKKERSMSPHINSPNANNLAKNHSNSPSVLNLSKKDGYNSPNVANLSKKDDYNSPNFANLSKKDDFKSPNVSNLFKDYSSPNIANLFMKDYNSPNVANLSEDDDFNSPNVSNLFKKNAINSPNVPNLSKKDVRLGPLLGSGGYGKVFHGIYKRRIVAVKILHTICKNPIAQFQSFKAELRIMYFRNPYVIRSLNATPLSRYDEGAWIVMEFVGKRNMQQLLNDSKERLLKSRRLKYAVQIARALCYTHTNCVAHLDLKPANILLTETDDIKLGDFGCCQQIDHDTGIPSPVEGRSYLTGTYAYRAPELLKGDAPTIQADIYSFGITLWQMLSRENPYGGENQHVIIFGVVSQNLRPSLPDIKDDPFEELYQALYTQCWRAIPQERPRSCGLLSILKLLKHYI